MIFRLMKPRLLAGFAVSLVALLLAPTPATGATLVVPDQYSTIQGAIDLAVGGDTIFVRPGTYPETIDFLGKAITVQSESGPLVTVIEGGPVYTPVVTFANSEGLDSILDGFTITRSGSGTNGRGIYCSESSPTVVNNIVRDIKTDSRGAGIYIFRGAPVFSGNKIVRNESTQYSGGGIRCSGSSASISNCSFEENKSGDGGGGISIEHSGIPEITNCVFTKNHALQVGGGIYIFGDLLLPHFRNVTISANTAGGEGGGLFCSRHATVEIENSIIWGNTAPLFPDLHTVTGSNFFVVASNIGGGWPGTGNINVDPLFAGPSAGDYHLEWGSPCIDAGNKSLLPAGMIEDMEGDPRVYQGALDMGADEFYSHLYATGDRAPGTAIDIRVTGKPHYPVALLHGADRVPQPFYTPYGPLFLRPPLMNVFPLGRIPTSGVLVQPAIVPPYAPPGWMLHYQALVGIQGSPFTKLTNAFSFVVE